MLNVVELAIDMIVQMDDQGPEFNSNLWKELHWYSDVLASNTTPYHPKGHGMAERINCTIQNMLKSLKAQEKLNWQQTTITT